MAWLVDEVFAPAWAIADALAAATPENIGNEFQKWLPDRRRIADGLKRAIDKLQTLPADVADEVQNLQRIFDGSIGTISFADAGVYFANSEMAAAARRGWQAVLRNAANVPPPAAIAEPGEVRDLFGVTAATYSAPAQAAWTAAVFLDKAEELRRRLKVWHVHDATQPVKVYSFLEAQAAIRETFRAIVLQGSHGPRPQPGIRIFPGRVPAREERDGIVGTYFHEPSSDIDSQLTRWLLRDYFEHLSAAGAKHEAEYLRLKVERILDAPIYDTRPRMGVAEQHLLEEQNAKGNDRPYSFIGGRKLDEALLDDLVTAARALVSTIASSASVVVESASDDPFSANARQIHQNLAVSQFHVRVSWAARNLGERPPTRELYDAIRSANQVADAMLEFAGREARVELARREGPARNPYGPERESWSVAEIESLLKTPPQLAYRAPNTTPAWKQEVKTMLEDFCRCVASELTHRLRLEYGERRALFDEQARRSQQQSAVTGEAVERLELRDLRRDFDEFLDEWKGVRCDFDPNIEGDEQRAERQVQETIRTLYAGRFVQLAARMVDALGGDRFPLDVPDPPISAFTDPGRMPEELTGTRSAAEAGLRIILWSAMAADPVSWDRTESFNGMMERWAESGLLCAHQPGDQWFRRTVHQPMLWVQRAFDSLAATPPSSPSVRPQPTRFDTGAQTKPKRSTVKGEAREKVVAALTAHHKYADGGCLHWEPIGVNELARQSGVSSDSVNRFFNREFGSTTDAKDGCSNYKVACRGQTKLLTVLRKLNGDLRLGPALFGRIPPTEGTNRDDE